MASTEVVQATNGVYLHLDSLPTAIAYNGDGTVNTIAVTFGADTYTQTFTYVAGAVAAISGWVKN